MTRLLPAVLLVACTAWAAGPVPGPRPPARVAALVDRAVGGGKHADDAEFLRRASLDLAGRIPTAARARAFLADTRPDRRARLIDELLASPEHAQHSARTWARLITAEEPAQRPALEKWLATRFAANAPWGETVSLMLAASGKGPETGFILSNVENRQPQPNKLAGSAARLFLGVQLQCAECHKHPFTAATQEDFWGLAAFFGRTKMNAKGLPGVAEAPPPPPKGKAKAAPAGVIAIPASAGKGVGKVVAARFPGGPAPTLDAEKPWRPVLAAWLTSRDNAMFARGTVNRVWGQLFGRGLVEPVADLHDDNPATHPALLDALAADFAASGHDLRHLLRSICLSDAYQRTSKGTAEGYARMPVKVMHPEALYDSLCTALGVKELKLAPAAGTGSGRGGTKGAGKESGRGRFLKAFATLSPETTPLDFTHGIPQALSLLNEPQLRGGTPLHDAVAKLPPAEAVDALFLATLSRPPNEAERRRLAGHITARPERGRAEVLWAILNSPEFALIP